MVHNKVNSSELDWIIMVIIVGVITAVTTLYSSQPNQLNLTETSAPQPAVIVVK